MYSYSLLPITTLPTRVTDTSSTLIDQIWTSQIENNVSNYVLKTDITDHYPVISVFKCDKYLANNPTYITKRILNQDSIDKFCNILSKINWSEVMACTCPNKAYNSFHNTFKEYFDKCFPVKNIKLNSKKERSPHITQGLKNSIREKNRLERLAHKWPLSYKERYRIYRNKLTSLLN